MNDSEEIRLQNFVNGFIYTLGTVRKSELEYMLAYAKQHGTDLSVSADDRRLYKILIPILRKQIKEF